MAKEDLELRKLEAEIEQLTLLKQQLSKKPEEKRSSFWQMPGFWEILKSLGVFLPLLFTSVGYYRSLEKDRQTQLKEAADKFFAASADAGPHLLAAYVDDNCGARQSQGDDGDECRQMVAGILVRGLKIHNDDISLARSEGALRTLKTLAPSSQIADQACLRVADDLKVIQKTYIQPAKEERDHVGDDPDARKAVAEYDSALRRFRLVVCAAVEVGLCPEASLKALAPEAWNAFQEYLGKNNKSACTT